MLYDPTVRSPVSEPWFKKLNDMIQYEWEYGSIEIVRADDWKSASNTNKHVVCKCDRECDP